jgi:tetratricopeptide (TPR) repeat protein
MGLFAGLLGVWLAVPAAAMDGNPPNGVWRPASQPLPVSGPSGGGTIGDRFHQQAGSGGSWGQSTIGQRFPSSPPSRLSLPPASGSRSGSSAPAANSSQTSSPYYSNPYSYYLPVYPNGLGLNPYGYPLAYTPYGYAPIYSSYGFAPVYSPYGYLFGANPYGYTYGVYPYSYLVPYRGGPILLPPVFMSADALFSFGAQALSSGMDQSNAPFREAQPARPRADDEGHEAQDERQVNLRASNPEAVARAGRFIGFGDTQFRNQKYADALQRYRKAMAAVPGLAEAYFREGYAQIAMGHYESAVKAFKQGLKADPNWPHSGFESDQLYGPNSKEKSAHIDALTEIAAKEPNNGSVSFLLGVCLYFDGQTDRAAPRFQRASQLAHGDSQYIDAFLDSRK